MPETVRITVFWAVMVLFAVHLGLALAAAAIPSITSVVGLSKVKRLKIFTDKFGQQAATFALLGGLWLFCVLAAVLAAVWFLAPAKAPYYLGLPLPLGAVAATVLGGAAAFLTYRGSWQRFKTQKPLHGLIGLSATLLLWTAFYVGLAASRPLALGLAPATDAAFLLPPGNSLFWRFLATGLPLSVGLAGAYTAAWLVWRRDRDDFGRDYYNFTMRLTARFAFGGLLLSLAGVSWLGLGLMPLAGELTTTLASSLGLFGTGTLLALVCFGFVMPQENALRHKLLLVAGFFGAVLALIGLCAVAASLIAPNLAMLLPAAPAAAALPAMS
ncbi:hypothetical protein [Solidesulfovibrio magneticus]|uniref:Hypothetical membrane protein n=1 Tax=Solidesulfovibrio magneticus (strain ATCC 700980 / DSM 13731 / RS-1) TaxID=573370 RepID=C4XKG0_SOLM1|nr:hypothetical protein [Solidesulfovibrio magneticus]BAH76900.1 hypothetical membrane protein [Solidesulfovibrio magneticus RS-1]